MMFFLVITILSLLAFNAGELLKPLLRWIYRTTSFERTLVLRKTQLKLEQSQFSMVDEFAKYSKLQRRINSIERELAEIQNHRLRNTLMVRMFCTYIVRFVLGLVLMGLGLYYRNTPLLHLNKKFDLFPLTSIMAYPSNIENAVSVPFWIMCCTSVGGLIKIIG